MRAPWSLPGAGAGPRSDIPSSADCRQLADRQVLEMLEAIEQRLGGDPRSAGIEASAELLEQLGFAQRPVRVTLGARHLLAFDAAAAGKIDANLVPHGGAGNFRVIVPVGLDRDLAHQRLHFGPPHKAVVVLAEPGTARDYRRGHRELNAELRLQSGLRLMVAQDQRMRIAQRDGDFLDFLRPQGPASEQLEHRVERPVGAVACWVFLDAEPVLDDFPLLPEASSRGLPIDFSSGGYRTQEPLRMLERVGGCGETDFGESRSEKARMRRAAGMERLRHRAEIGHDAAA